MKRKFDSNQYNHPNWSIDNYDLVRHFIDLNGCFPNNTRFVGNNFNKGYIRYDALLKKLEALNVDKEFLLNSSTYNLGTRATIIRVGSSFIVMENIHSRKTETLDIKDELILSDNTQIIGSLTILHATINISDELKSVVESCLVKITEVPTIGIISRDNSGFFLSEIKMDAKISHELELHYGDKFVEFHSKLVDKLATTSKGLTLLHGDPGTGKSSYIRKLIYDLKEKTSKKIILVPNSLISYLIDPDFNTFLLDTIEAYQFDEEYDIDSSDEMPLESVDVSNKKEPVKGMIMILEDAESVLMKRESSLNNQGTSNILNLTDGLLNDIFGIQIIATYNTSDENIDDAVKRSKRLIAKRNFKKLSTNDAKRLAEYLEINKDDIDTIKGTMSVSDVYALIEKDVEDILIDKEKSSKGSVGFR